MLRDWRFLTVAACLAAAIGLYLTGGRSRRLPQAPPAMLPASARILLPPPHKKTLDLTVAPHQELDYRVGMQAGATLVYAWSAGRRATLSGKFPDQAVDHSRDGHGAFEAQSSGWYHWRWNNPSGDSIVVHLILTGYYELETVPPLDTPRQ